MCSVLPWIAGTISFKILNSFRHFRNVCFCCCLRKYEWQRRRRRCCWCFHNEVEPVNELGKIKKSPIPSHLQQLKSYRLPRWWCPSWFSSRECALSSGLKTLLLRRLHGLLFYLLLLLRNTHEYFFRPEAIQKNSFLYYIKNLWQLF